MTFQLLKLDLRLTTTGLSHYSVYVAKSLSIVYSNIFTYLNQANILCDEQNGGDAVKANKG